VWYILYTQPGKGRCLLLSVEDIRRLKRQGKSVKEIAEQDGVGVSTIRARLERDEKPWFGKARQARYYVNLSDNVKKSRRKYAIASTRKTQEKTIGTASNRYQRWTSQEINELEGRVKKGETSGETAVAMHRTSRGINRPLHRFGMSELRSELVGT